MATEKDVIEEVVSQQTNVDDSIDYISAINEIKQNSVDKVQYEKLKAENKKLLDALVEGKQVDVPKEEKLDVNQLRGKLFKEYGDLANVNFIDTSLKLRKALIENGERDPFLPYGDRVVLTQEMIDTAEHTADVLQECLDFAEGDSGIFTAELQRRTVDALPNYGRRKF